VQDNPPNFRKLFVGFDGSPQVKRAVEVAMELAECVDAEVVVIAVAQLPKPATMVEVHAVLDDAREHYTAAFEKLVRNAKEHGLDMTTEIVVAIPRNRSSTAQRPPALTWSFSDTEEHRDLRNLLLAPSRSVF